MERKDHGLLRRLILHYGVGLWRTIRNQWSRMWSNLLLMLEMGQKPCSGMILDGTNTFETTVLDIYILNQQKMTTILEVRNHLYANFLVINI
ncbi:hypothetical protein MTR67_012534 [Solanum verrucosum]|uniref:Uncharacterized protein n=1 Tax=Solanum verrucosum TaxID=315347 RepID=A0AAF0THK5_SOLVR|nr:hypothetical protein MTR67_012534 [Solanum verrucosum]